MFFASFLKKRRPFYSLPAFTRLPWFDEPSWADFLSATFRRGREVADKKSALRGITFPHFSGCPRRTLAPAASCRAASNGSV
jgi:hypothetical protein